MEYKDEVRVGCGGGGGVDGYVACLVQRVGIKVWGAKKYISL